MIRFIALFLAIFLGVARAAELPPPTTNPSLAGNNGGAWAGAGFTFSNCTFTGLSISCPGAVSGYPGAGIPQSTGSAWGTSITPGTGVVTALGNATNAASGLLTFSGAFGTPTSLTLTNATGLPYAALPALSANQWLGALTGTTPSGQNWPSCSASGNWLQYTSGTGVGCITSGYPLAQISGFGASVEAALAIAVGTAGSPVLNGGVLGTPSSGTLTNTSGFPAANLSGTALPSGIVTSSLTSLGTIATGVWQGTAVNPQWGGTGQNFSGSTGVTQFASGTASVSTTLANGTAATTQTGADNTTKIATDTYVDNESGLIGATSISTTGGSTTLTAAQYSPPTIIVTGALTSAATLIFPNNGNWHIQNNTTGAFTVTAKTASGTGTTISQTYSRDIVANGTNVIVGDSDYFSVGAYTNTSSGALDPFYGCLRKSLTQICRIVSFADSILTCYQISPCTFGPYMGINSPMLALRNELLKTFVQYSTGLRIPFRLINSNTTVDGGEGGYTLTSGTVAVSTIYGPQLSGYAISGGSLLNCSATCVLTINVGQGYRALNIYCVQTTSNTGWTVTVGGTSLGTACGTTAGSTQGAVQSFSNASLTTATASSWSISGTTLTVTTVATGTFAVGGVLSGTSVTGGTTIVQQMTGATSGGAGTYQLSASSTASSGTLTQTGGLVNSTFTLTSTGTSSFLGGYEAITTMGNVGVAVDNMGEGAISSAFWTSATGLGWFNLLAGQVGLCIHEGGENDAQNPGVVTPAQAIANFQTVATACNNRGAAFSFFIPTPYNSTTVNQYAFIQQYAWSYGQNPTQFGAAAGTLPWDVMTLSDAWAGQGVTGGAVSNTTGGSPNFIVQDTAANIAASIAAGLLQPQDGQHPSDYGSCIITSYMFRHLFARNTFNCNYTTITPPVNNVVELGTSAAYTNTGTGFITICEGANGACAAGSHPFQFQITGNQILNLRCHMVIQVSGTATLSMTIAGSAGTPQILNQRLVTTPTLATPGEAIIRTATYGTAVTSASLTTTATDLGVDYYVTVQHAATVNGTATLSVQAHPSANTLTIQPGSRCEAE